MSNFSREATNLLRAAEDALSGRQPSITCLKWKKNDSEGNWCNSGEKNDCDGTMRAGGSGVEHVLELQRQLRVAMSEISSLRSELMAERESRSQTLTSMGRCWKEEVLLELKTAEHQSRRALAELEANVQQQRKEDETARVVMQRQLSDVLRSTKVRERSHFDQQERVQEQLDSLRERLEAAVAECGLLRVESTQQLEKERATLAQRLDVELLRYVDMRREEQRERETLKQQLKADVASFGRRVQDLVDEAWSKHVTAMQRSLRDPIDTFERQMSRHGEIVSAMEVKVNDCASTCRAELRLQTATLQERIAALEAGNAVTTSRVDRAERKADAAQEATSRTDAGLVVARDVAERAGAQAQRAMEEVQRAEDSVRDRDARLAHLEHQLSAVLTVEKLRVEIESVRRMAQRAESGVDALRHVCERDVQQAEHSRHEIDNCTDRVNACEQLTHRLQTAVEAMMERRVPQFQQRISALEEARESLAASAMRGDDVAQELKQRLQTLEGTLHGFSERIEQTRRDVMGSSQAVATRLEAASGAALRSEADSMAARGEMERVERRLSQLELQANRTAADCLVLRSAAEEHTKETSSLLEQTTAAAEQLVTRSEAKVLQQMRHVEGTFAQRADELETRIEENIEKQQRQKQGDKRRTSDARIPNDLECVQKEQHQLARDVQACNARIDLLKNALDAMGDTLERRCQECVLQRDWRVLRNSVVALETQLRAVVEDAAVQQHKRQEEENYLSKLQQPKELLSECCTELQEGKRSDHITAIHTSSLLSSSSITMAAGGSESKRGTYGTLSAWARGQQSPLDDDSKASSKGVPSVASGIDVVLQAQHNESPTTTPHSQSLTKANDISRSSSAESASTLRSQSPSSGENTAGESVTHAWGPTAPSGASSTASSSREDAVSGTGSTARDNGAEIGGSLMQPPQESSSSTFSAEKDSLQGRPKDDCSGHLVGGGKKSITVTPFAPNESDANSASATSVKNAADIGDDNQGSSPKRATKWYDDWDDDTTASDNPAAPVPPEGDAGVADLSSNDIKMPLKADNVYSDPRKAFVSDVDGDNAVSDVQHHDAGNSIPSLDGSYKKGQCAQSSTAKLFTNFDDTTSEEGA